MDKISRSEIFLLSTPTFKIMLEEARKHKLNSFIDVVIQYPNRLITPKFTSRKMM